jgi:molybdate transport system substrate-binding protein
MFPAITGEELSVMSRRHFIALTIVCGIVPWAARAAAPTDSLTVFAAASLTDVLQELGAAYTKETGTKVELSFGATSILARQIESGAHADVFFSADEDWMDYLDQRSLIRKATRTDMLGNRLALVAPVASAVQLKIGPKFPLLAALKGGRLATGDPDSVPVGRYARSALTSLGVWNDVADHLVRADNVRTALAFVARGEAPLGIVYETDARSEKQVRTVDVFPEESHPPIRYPVALTSGADAKAASFVQFLRGSTGTAAFEKYGFIVLH